MSSILAAIAVASWALLNTSRASSSSFSSMVRTSTDNTGRPLREESADVMDVSLVDHSLDEVVNRPFVRVQILQRGRFFQGPGGGFHPTETLGESRFEPPCSPRGLESLQESAVAHFDATLCLAPRRGKRRRPCCGRRSLSLAAPP